MWLDVRRKWLRHSLAERKNILADAIDLFGEELLSRLEEEKAAPELQAQVDLLEWLQRRTLWMACLPLSRIDGYIQKAYHKAKRLPAGWKFSGYVAEAIENERIWRAINGLL